MCQKILESAASRCPQSNRAFERDLRKRCALSSALQGERQMPSFRSSMKPYFISISLVLMSVSAHAFSPQDGEYLCDDCNGYMEVKKLNNSNYQIWLGVGSGSCGGDVSINKRLHISQDGVVKYKRNLGIKVCETTISFSEKNAVVTETCPPPENSTCNIEGTYPIRRNGL